MRSTLSRFAIGLSTRSSIASRPPTTLDRVNLGCSGAAQSGEQLISLSTGHSSHRCNNRHQAQCIDDGGFDSYYMEWCDYGNPSCRQVAPNQYFCDAGARPAGTCVPTKLFRKVLGCNDESKRAEQVIDLTSGYGNYTCGNRFPNCA